MTDVKSRLSPDSLVPRSVHVTRLRITKTVMKHARHRLSMQMLPMVITSRTRLRNVAAGKSVFA